MCSAWVAPSRGGIEDAAECFVSMPVPVPCPERDDPMFLLTIIHFPHDTPTDVRLLCMTI